MRNYPHYSYTVETGKKVYCDDISCRGHKTIRIYCTCGKPIYTYSDDEISGSNERIDRAHLSHRVDEMEKLIYARSDS